MTQAQPGEKAGTTLDDRGPRDADLGTAPSNDLDNPQPGQADDHTLTEINGNDCFTRSVVPDRSAILLNLPPLLSHPNPRMRLLFHHCGYFHFLKILVTYADFDF